MYLLKAIECVIHMKIIHQILLEKFEVTSLYALYELYYELNRKIIHSSKAAGMKLETILYNNNISKCTALLM